MSENVVTLDVREDFLNGREPFSRVMAAVAKLQPDEKLRLVAPFEPKPLFSVLGNQGFEQESKKMPSGDWEVLFTRRGGIETSFVPPTHPPCGTAKTELAEILDLDARGLEPPQPMVKILEALTNLPAKTGIRARTDRRPMHLYAHLEERGFVGETTEQTDGSFLTHIRRR
jgi:uncharacterized protein (DUF2249 family)